MSVVEDSRKVLQDFIAPELRAVSVRLRRWRRRLTRMSGVPRNVTTK